MGVSAVIAVGVVGGGSMALAASSPSGQTPMTSLASLASKVLPGKAPRGALRGLAEKDILAASGLTQAQVKAGLKAGKSISQMITDNGGDPATVETTVIADLKGKLDKAVSAGKVTPDQEATALAKAQTQLHTFLNKTPKAPRKAQAKIAQVGLADAAKVIGIQPADLRAAVKSGKSVAQVANDHGISTSALVSGVTADVDARIDAALAAGKIDAAHVAKLKAGISSAVTKLVDRVPHAKGSPG
jgi:hypothetical protein